MKRINHLVDHARDHRALAVGLFVFGVVGWLVWGDSPAGEAATPRVMAAPQSGTTPNAPTPPVPPQPTVPPQPPTAPPPAVTPVPAVAPADSFAAERERFMNEVLEKIAGREKAPAESVFTNIKVLTGIPAGNVPRIMNMGFGRSLGVSCDHCHVIGDWAADDKPKKQVARDMWTMTRAINTDFLAKVQNLESKQPSVNCTTCHRGQLKPAQQF